MAGFPDGDDLQAWISQWRQGDYVLGSQAMVWGYHPNRPLTDIAAALAEGAETLLGIALASGEVNGLAVVSQTCDIIRSFLERPFVQVAPLKLMPKTSDELAVMLFANLPASLYLESDHLDLDFLSDSTRI